MLPQGGGPAFTVLENNYYLGNEETGGEKRGLRVSHHGAVLRLQKGDRLFVETRTGYHTKLKTSDPDTYFGMYAVS